MKTQAMKTIKNNASSSMRHTSLGAREGNQNVGLVRTMNYGGRGWIGHAIFCASVELWSVQFDMENVQLIRTMSCLLLRYGCIRFFFFEIWVVFVYMTYGERREHTNQSQSIRASTEHVPANPATNHTSGSHLEHRPNNPRLGGTPFRCDLVALVRLASPCGLH